MAEEKKYSENYVILLQEELHSLKEIAKNAIKIAGNNYSALNQCIIKWDWDQLFEFPEGRSRPISLLELVTQAIKEKYTIVSVTVTEYDDTGAALHAFIVALRPDKGKLHIS